MLRHLSLQVPAFKCLDITLKTWCYQMWLAIIGDCDYWSYPSGRFVRLYTDGCVVDSGMGLMGPCTPRHWVPPSTWGTPPDMGYPPGHGVPPDMEYLPDMGYPPWDWVPPDLRCGTPTQTWDGVPPTRHGMGYPLPPDLISEMGYPLTSDLRWGTPPPQVWTDWKYYLPSSFGCER